MLTVGDLNAAHIGATFTLDVPAGLAGGENPVTAPLVRVQHNGAAVDALGSEQPAETLVSLGSCAVALSPSHPIERADETSG